jgi:hypothetical protein
MCRALSFNSQFFCLEIFFDSISLHLYLSIYLSIYLSFSLACARSHAGIASHAVVTRDHPRQRHSIVGPCDQEIHFSAPAVMGASTVAASTAAADRRLYILDVARLMPCMRPLRDQPASFLTDLFRPEALAPAPEPTASASTPASESMHVSASVLPPSPVLPPPSARANVDSNAHADGAATHASAAALSESANLPPPPLSSDAFSTFAERGAAATEFERRADDRLRHAVG